MGDFEELDFRDGGGFETGSYSIVHISVAVAVGGAMMRGGGIYMEIVTPLYSAAQLGIAIGICTERKKKSVRGPFYTTNRRHTHFPESHNTELLTPTGSRSRMISAKPGILTMTAPSFLSSCFELLKCTVMVI